jgi:S-adenosylmethionine decarboxylase
MEHKPQGMHFLADMHGVEASLLENAEALQALLIQAAETAGARVLFQHFHAFGEGKGITGVVLLAESHISIHTWPEAAFAAADIFMCGSARPDVALAMIIKGLQPTRCNARPVSRGDTRPETTSSGNSN